MYKPNNYLWAAVILVGTIGLSGMRWDFERHESLLSSKATLFLNWAASGYLEAPASLSYQRSSAKKRNQQRKAKMEDHEKHDFAPRIATAITEFKAQRYNREKPAKTLLPLLKPGMSISAIEEILGPPDDKFWYYALFYSSTLILRFDQDVKIVDVSSDLLSEVETSEGRGKDATDPLVIAAISEFKSQPYSRQKPAKILIPLIRSGMSMEEAEKMLGSPQEKVWQYKLFISSDASLSIRFNDADEVEKASLVESARP